MKKLTKSSLLLNGPTGHVGEPRTSEVETNDVKEDPLMHSVNQFDVENEELIINEQEEMEINEEEEDDAGDVEVEEPLLPNL